VIELRGVYDVVNLMTIIGLSTRDSIKAMQITPTNVIQHAGTVL